MIYDAIIHQVLEQTIRIQQIPAPTFSEGGRAKYIFDCFEKEGLEDVSLDPIGNVFARIPGLGEKPPLVVSAHLDTVFPHDTNLTVSRKSGLIYGPGIGDNALGLAGLLGLIWGLRIKKKGEKSYGYSSQMNSPALPGDIWLVANVGEEGLGNLQGMRAVVNRFDNSPLAYIVLEGMALGQVYHRALGVKRCLIRFLTPGGHSWVDYGVPSAINELADLINKLGKIRLPSKPRTTLNIGVVGGGTSINTIASEAFFELDLRSESEVVLRELGKQVDTLVNEAEKRQVKVISEDIGSRPAGCINPEHPLIQLVISTLQSLGIQPILSVGSTDANIPLSLGFPAVCLGLTTGSGAHTLSENINPKFLSSGLAQLIAVVEGVYNLDFRVNN